MSRNLSSFSCLTKSIESNNSLYRNHLSTVLKVFFFAFLLSTAATEASAQRTINWKLDATVNGVEFYHAIVECNSKKFVFLKFNNKNTKPAKVTWKEEFLVRKNGDQKQGPFKEKEINLPPGQTSITSCADDKKAGLLTYPDQTNPVYDADIVNFSFRTIKVAR